jgi:hypothetical protein
MIAHQLPHPPVVNAMIRGVPESSECTNLIRKLRWIGLDDEARRLEEALRTFLPNQRGAVLAEPVSTD